MENKTKPKPKYHVYHDGFTDEFFEWEEEKAESKYRFWKNYYDSDGKRVIFYEDGKRVKQVTYKVEIIETEYTNDGETELTIFDTCKTLKKGDRVSGQLKREHSSFLLSFSDNEVEENNQDSKLLTINFDNSINISYSDLEYIKKLNK